MVVPPPPPLPPFMTPSLSYQGQISTPPQSNRTPSPQDPGFAQLPSFYVPSRLGAQNPHHVPPGWTPPTSVTPQPQSAVNYSLKATVTKSTPLLL